MVRAEARRRRSHLVRAAHDHGRSSARRTPAASRSRSHTARPSPMSTATASRTSSSASATGRIRTRISIQTPYGDPVLYWYRTVRNPKAPGGAELVPELIHNLSGVGSHAYAARSEQGRPARHRDARPIRHVRLLGAEPAISAWDATPPASFRLSERVRMFTGHCARSGLISVALRRCCRERPRFGESGRRSAAQSGTPDLGRDGGCVVGSPPVKRDIASMLSQ